MLWNDPKYRGQKFGRLTVVDFVSRQNGVVTQCWIVRCECGREKRMGAYSVRNGHIVSCGCLQREGARERGHLRKVEIINFLKSRKHTRWSFVNADAWPKCRFRCECGTERDVHHQSILRGVSHSCGCYARENSGSRTHGKSKTAEYKLFKGIVQRCTNPNNPTYAEYGGRGIKISERWLNSFEAFLADVGPRPSPRHELDRYPDNNGNYEPGNVRWATRQQNMSNRRNSIFVYYKGVRMTAADAARALRIPYGRLHSRLRRGTLENFGVVTERDLFVRVTIDGGLDT